MNRRRLALAAGVFACAAAAAPAADEQTESGRRIFHRGGAAGEVTATFSATSAPLPPRLRRCAGCHGPDGRGTREGGVEIPAIAWTALAAPRDAAPGRPGRPAYDGATLLRALADGIDPAGRPLAAGMPRFQLAPIRFSALSDYLRVVGTDRDLDPGMTAGDIRVGTVLPLSGAQAASGEAMRAGLEHALAAAGPIYGRSLRLVAVDAGGDAAAALRRLLASDQVFALVATLLPELADAAEDVADIPVIGPLVPSAAQPAAHQFHLLASVADQMRVLVDRLAAETPHPLRLAVVGADGPVADAVADQATRNNAVIARLSNGEGLAAVQPLDAVLALPDVDLDRLGAGLPDRRGDWLLAGAAEAMALDRATDPRLRLVLPLLPAGSRAGDAATPPLAVAAVATLVEGLKRMGARASRVGLIDALETLRAFPTGVLPPLTFARGQHVGSRAALVIRPDRGHGFAVLGGWRTPR